MAHLIFDIGNTRSKMAIMEHGKMLEQMVMEDAPKVIANLCRRYNVDKAIASVVGHQPDFAKLLPEYLYACFHQLSYNSILPITMDYDTPQTLGMDRVASAVGARILCPEGALVIVDAGSCITVDLLDDNNCFRGGAILPGIQMRFRAMHDFTDALPQVALSPDERKGLVDTPITGKSTRTSLIAGVCNTSLFEIEGFMHEYSKRYPNVKLFLTGGDAVFFANRLFFPNFANSDLMYIGLDKILELNVIV